MCKDEKRERVEAEERVIFIIKRSVSLYLLTDQCETNSPNDVSTPTQFD